MTKNQPKNQKGWEEEIIELYEMVAIQAITPNQARKRFIKLHCSELIRELEEIEERIDLAFSCNYMPQTYLEIVNIFKELKKELKEGGGE